MTDHENPLPLHRVANLQLKKAAIIMDLPRDYRRIFSEPIRVMITSFPIIMDDGSIQVFGVIF